MGDPNTSAIKNPNNTPLGMGSKILKRVKRIVNLACDPVKK